MFQRLLRALTLCAGLLIVAAPETAPAANFGLAASVPEALDAPAIQVRGGAHWRHFWRVYRRRHRMHRHRHVRRWHHHRRTHRHAGRGHGRLHFEAPRGAGREPAPAAPAPKSSPRPSRGSSAPTLY